MDNRVSDETARNRWMVINAVRLSGVAMIVVGILIARAVIDAPAWAGFVLIAVGLADVFVVPTMLARRWATPRE